MITQRKKFHSHLREVKKRTGEIVPFDKKKIEEAIYKALTATDEGGKTLSRELSNRVIKILNRRFKKGEIPSVEEIQDIVEEVLILENLVETSKAYILYRDQRRALRESRIVSDEATSLVDEYLQVNDWEVKENSNMAFSLQGLNHYVSAYVAKKYWLRKVYPKEIREAVENGDFHIHNLDILATYCCGWDLYDLILQGFGGVFGKIQSKPPKHFRSALGQVVNFFYTLQGEGAGAQAFSNFDTLFAPFIRYDNLNYLEVKQSLQEFLFNCNVPTRTGFQTPFENVSLDLKVPAHFRDLPVIIGGQPQKETYKDFQKEMDLFNQALCEIYTEGDASGRVFTFPIPTYNITKDFEWNNPAYEGIWKMTAKYGIPYFSNFINSDLSPEDARSMCCRLRLDNRELYKRGGGLFGANPLTGCYDEKTEILTENGWKLFKDLTIKEKVFTLTENNKIELHRPERIFKYKYNGEMYQFKTRSLDLLITPNHRLLVDESGSGKRKFVEAKGFDFNNQRIPKQSIWEAEEKEWFILPAIEYLKYGRQGRTPYKVAKDALKIKMDNWLRFFGFWLAEGCTDNEKIAKRHGYRIIITQVNKQKKEEIKKVLDKLPFNYFSEGKNNFVIYNKQLWTYLRQFGNKYQKFIPKEIKNLGKRQLKILFDWMVKGDGCVRKNTGQINYWTASQKLADDLQEIILKLGWLGTCTAQQKKNSVIKRRKINFHLIYVIGVQKAKHYRLRGNNIKKIHYRGKVYCCEVKNHTVFVRRNGRVTWCGNSIGVVTINIPHLGYLSKTKKGFFEGLAHIMDLAKESLEIKRKILENWIEKGLYPYAKHYLSGVKKMRGTYWGNHFSTIGLLGMNECLLNFLGIDIGNKKGIGFAAEILDFMRERLINYQKETGNLYNLEATPAEGTSYRLALKDKKKYPDIITAGEKEPYYTNSTQLPVNYTDDLFEALKLQDSLQTKYTGGTVFHAFLGEAISDPEAVKSLIKLVFEKFHLPYFTLTPTFSVCPTHGYIAGEHFICPQCTIEQPCEVYSRIVGYLRPVQQWHKGKQEEFNQRSNFNI